MTKKLLIASRIERIEHLSAQVKRFSVRPVHRPTFPDTTPGSHVLVRHKNGLLRSYSLCGGTEDPGLYQFAVLRETDGKGGSVAFHDNTAEGDSIHVSYPTASLPLHPEANSHVFIAGGIGVTPFVPLALAAQQRGHSATLHYAVRTASAAAFKPTLQAIPRLAMELYASDQNQRLDVAAVVSGLAPEQHLYVCGPPRLLDAAGKAAQAAGLNGRVHLESFSGLDAAEANSGDPFTAYLSLSKRTVDVPANKSLLQALRSSGSGLDVDSSCEGGVCGACRVTLLGGDAVHRDICLTPREREQNIITCVSRGKGTITLHL
ncbi:PDR/VanB family oxidoreductase [Arthrobacter sp. H35-D1]|uniref:PDR/VanB family oxidoreductase n=1 Tax=Arthrobacter sp. H35-D1 TaxID=3046202 RepID=UPI0024B8B4F7|nr:PDR/VanB family oxidoreductase [Arthrobacter sp. H35-D1]MDJ0312566.1 PDR/VanB family oxidoreductase [Arthrobacter sp. H35-D1]